MAGAICLNDVSVRFVLQHQKSRSFQDILVHLFNPSEQALEEFWALRGVTFEVGHGETIGLIGQNGSGKSTILKLISRIIEPTKGSVKVEGKVSALIELGAGFHPDLTGRENIYLNGSILGLGRKQIDGIFDEIVAFSELDRFIDTPVKHYSSGMYMRLGFSVATCVNPDILIIDEVLAVGDEAFQRKCMDRIFDFKRRGKTILFVSHGLQVVEQLCDRVVWLHHGIVREHGAGASTVRSYIRELQRRDEAAREAEHEATELAADQPVAEPVSTSASIRGISLMDRDGHERYSFRTGEALTIRVHFHVHDRGSDHAIDVELRRNDGLLIQKLRSPRFGPAIASKNGEGTVEVHLDAVPLLAGTYDVTPGIRLAHEGSSPLAMSEEHRCIFSVWSEQDEAGLVRIEHGWRGVDLRESEIASDPVSSPRS